LKGNACVTTQEQLTQTRHKWATFTYIGKETLYITNAFRHTDLKIAFRTNNTLDNVLRLKTPPPDKFSASGVYRLTCPDCHKAYIGQTGRSFSKRYDEHRRVFHNNSHTSNFVKHLLDNNHSFGPINNIMQVLHHQKKGAHLNTIENFYIHVEHATGNHLYDNHTIFPNKIFNALIKPNSLLPHVP